eukprot:TRINITY_DN4873_c0_g1_i2.p1 TRINITY_DN4873_c0_g1~~TRINITY_DN4873_c0_g1_i2.p1  ORF type:complete len:123 (-),score=21.97 TRINITY_DN4873_c0_g1_i2:158-499(-)
MSLEAQLLTLGTMPIVGMCFVIAKVEGDISWSWHLVFIPLWFTFFVFFALQIHSFIKGHKAAALVKGVILSCLFLFFVFLSLRLQGDVDWKYAHLSIPLFLLEGVAVILVSSC